MSKLDSWVDNKIVQNLFIWFCLFLILTGAVQAENRALTAAYIILLFSPAIYINNLFILPLFNKNWLRFATLFILNVTVFSVIILYFLLQSVERAFTLMLFLSIFGILILALTFGSAIKISRDSFIRRQEDKNAELKLLKAQLNPHFLFNTLNNLYGLSVIKSDKLPDLMLKLSDLLRYSLYDTKETFVALERELQYLENYMSLEQIRLEDRTDIKFSITGEISKNKIAPMLLIVFVENAFKHLVQTDTERSSVIVNVEVIDNKLLFSSVNSIDKKVVDKPMESGESGIGLKNAQKRLELLYPERHKLIIDSNDGTYEVKLKLDL
ncbi:sensor histidine kinase [Winogradskyella sp.]|uniref:sensor histidine kinase n=1 Tax=Winogradskyella sp. TaxID=1883156 RepID=UPI0026078990|nr:histidine kinase [Winogradskyella sp.]